MSNQHPREQAALYNDILTAAAGQLAIMKRDGHITERWYHQLVAALNSTLYTLAFALPPGTLVVESNDEGRHYYIAEVQQDEPTKVETSGRKGKTKSL